MFIGPQEMVAIEMEYPTNSRGISRRDFASTKRRSEASLRKIKTKLGSIHGTWVKCSKEVREEELPLANL